MAEKKPTRFYPALDILLLREVVAVFPMENKTKWEKAQQNINRVIEDRNIFVTLRACKDRLRHLTDLHRRDEISSLRASGTEEEYDERARLLTEILERDRECEAEKENDKTSAKDDQEKKGKEIRDAAMKALVVKKNAAKKNPADDEEQLVLTPKKRRSNSYSTEYVDYLNEKLALEKEKFEVEKKEREARILRDNQMMTTMMNLVERQLSQKD
ncbi:uncharacterized protein LOC135503328 [Lineus longissimus]|uniref:uncharacterized protein LOC135503328 n=1 Tax=Lineus longissimus TaxID=88925 RepID=UPI002B4C4727